MPPTITVVVIAAIAVAYFAARHLSRSKSTSVPVTGLRQTATPVPTDESRRRETEKQWKRSQVEGSSRRDREPK